MRLLQKLLSFLMSTPLFFGRLLLSEKKINLTRLYIDQHCINVIPNIGHNSIFFITLTEKRFANANAWGWERLNVIFYPQCFIFQRLFFV